MDETEEMVSLLLSRARMLKFHCPRCSLPLFEKEGRVLCVKCGEVRVEREDGKSAEERSPPGRPRNILERKRNELLKRLELESDPKVIASILEAMRELEKALKGSR